MRNNNIAKNVGYLALRYLMITVFVFMCVPIIALNGDVLGPVLGLFYFAALIYYFWFTMKAEGTLDVNRVRTGQAPRFRWKGAVCALFLAVPLALLVLFPLSFGDPVKEEYREYFTGEAVSLEEDDAFNRDLRAASGKQGYVSSITFGEDRTIDRIVYETADGLQIVCDGTKGDTYERAYRLTEIAEDGTENYVYYPENEADLTEAQLAAFEECKYAADDIKTVLGTAPNWQTLFNMIKFVCMVALSHVCEFLAGDSTLMSSLVYCVCLAVLVLAAQIGYEMGYRNIELLRKKQPEKNSKAGDSVVIQRGGSNRES